MQCDSKNLVKFVLALALKLPFRTLSELDVAVTNGRVLQKGTSPNRVLSQVSLILALLRSRSVKLKL